MRHAPCEIALYITAFFVSIRLCAFVTFSLKSGMDFLGEVFADFFGVTEPKYKYEIEAYQRKQAKLAKEAEEEKQRIEQLDASQLRALEEGMNQMEKSVSESELHRFKLSQ